MTAIKTWWGHSVGQPAGERATLCNNRSSDSECLSACACQYTGQHYHDTTVLSERQLKVGTETACSRFSLRSALARNTPRLWYRLLTRFRNSGLNYFSYMCRSEHVVYTITTVWISYTFPTCRDNIFKKTNGVTGLVFFYIYFVLNWCSILIDYVLLIEEVAHARPFIGIVYHYNNVHITYSCLVESAYETS